MSPCFKGIVQSFEQNNGAWEEWYRNAEPESPDKAELPGEWAGAETRSC